MNNKIDWSKPTTNSEAYRRTGGRRHYNSWRKMLAVARRLRLLRLWVENPYLSKADLARRLGVHRSTVTRDIQALKAQEARRPDGKCVMCGKAHKKPGLGLAATAEWLSDAKRSMPNIF